MLRGADDEVGHMLGMQHPYRDEPSVDAGEPALPAAARPGRRLPRDLWAVSSRATVLAVLSAVLLASGGRARAFFESPPIALETPDRQLAERVLRVWDVMQGRDHRITRVSDGYRIALAPYPHFEGGFLITPSVEEVLGIGDLHEAVARAFSTEHQQVIELRPRPSGDGAVVIVAVDADAAALVVTGNAALDVRVPHEALAVRYTAAPEVPAGIVVRELRAQSGDVPLEVRVPRDARVSLVTRRRPIRLSADYDGASAWITVSGVPEVGAYRTEVLLDDRALGPLGPGGRVAVPLTRRSRRVEARLFAESGERLEWTRLTLRGVALHPLRLRAGGGAQCVTLDSDAHASVGRLVSRRDLRAVHEGEPDAEGELHTGERICAWAPLLARGHDEIIDLSSARGRERVVLAIEVESLSPAVVYGVPIAFFVGALAILLFPWWPRRNAPATHLAWIRASVEGYRDVEPPRWRVALLPVEETPLEALDESLSTAAHKVARSGRDARFTLARAVVVAPPAPLPTTTQSADVIVPSGTQLLDGTLRLAVVSDEVAAGLRGGAVLAPPPADAVEHARAAGYIGELVIPEAPSPSLRALMALTMAALATAVALSPALFAAIGVIAPAPWAESSTTAAAGLALCAVGVLILARRARSPARRT